MKPKHKLIALIVILACTVIALAALLRGCGEAEQAQETTQPAQTVSTTDATDPSETEEITQPTETEPETEPVTEPLETEPEETEPEETEPEETQPAGNPYPGGGAGSGPSISDTDQDNEEDEEEQIVIPAPGAVNNPYVHYLSELPASAATVKQFAGEELYYDIYGMVGVSTLTVEDANAVVSYQGVAYSADVNGVVTVDLQESADGAPVSFSVINNGSEDERYILNFTYPQGSESNPIALQTLDQIVVSLEEGDTDGCFYTWTPLDNCNASVILEAVTEGVVADVILTDTASGVTVSLSESLAAGEESAALDLLANEALLIQILAKPNEAGEIPAAEITVTATVQAAAGTQDNPHEIVEVPFDTEILPGGTHQYFNIYGVGGMILTIEDPSAYVICNEITYGADENGVLSLQLEPSMGRFPTMLAIGNGGEEEAVYTVTFHYPLGSIDNPEAVEDGYYTAAVEAGSEGYYYTWTAPEAGTATVSILSETGWKYCVNSMTGSFYGDIHYCDEEIVVSSETVAVTAGEQLQIMISTYDTESWETPAGSVDFEVSFAAVPGTMHNPHTVTVWELPGSFETGSLPVGSVVYYDVYYVNGAVLTIENAAGLSLTHNGVAYTADENGIISFQVTSPDSRTPVSLVFSNLGEAEQSAVVSFVQMVGADSNPEILEDISQFAVSLMPGDEDGYYLQWTATETGILTLTPDSVTEGVEVDICLSSTGDISLPTLSESQEAGLTNVSIPVQIEDVITIQVFAKPDEGWNIPAADLSVSGVVYGTETNPIQIFDTQTTFSVPAGSTLYYCGRFLGMDMTLTGENVTVSHAGVDYSAENGSLTLFVTQGDMWNPPNFAVTNTGAEDAQYPVSFTYPVGSIYNPAAITEGDHAATVEAATDGCYYLWTAPADGYVTVTMNTTDGWLYCLTNQTTSYYGDNHYSDEDPLINSETLEVFPGDQVLILVNTYDPESWETPAGTVDFTVSFRERGLTAEDPVLVLGTETTISVPAGATRYYCGRFLDMIMTLTGDAVTVTHADTTYAAENGAVTLFLTEGDMWNPPVFAVANLGAQDASYAVSFTYPLGTVNNPAAVESGDHVATLEAATNGYYFLWTAPADGNMTVTITTQTGWMYCMTNITSYYYGDNHYSNDDPVCPSDTFHVSAGDQVQMVINTHDPDSWEAPAGSVSFSITFQEVPWTVFEVENAPAAYTCNLLENQKLTYVDITEAHEAVLGTDGLYHLDSETGPVLLLNLGKDAPYLSVEQVAEDLQARVYFYDANGVVTSKTDYCPAIAAYCECADPEEGVYPLTEELMEILQQVGTFKGWYNSNHYACLFDTEMEVNVDTAWMFACCYVTTE